MLARKFVVYKLVEGELEESNLKIVEEKLPEELEDGEVLCKAEWYSIDPYIRLFVIDLAVGQVVPGSQVARVIKSRCPEFEEGSLIFGHFGWRDWTIHKPEKDEQNGNFWTRNKFPDLKGLEIPYGLGALGMPGVTAFCGYLKIRAPKKGETVVISSAAGAVGNIVGQLAKLHECKAVGITGSDEKVSMLKQLGFDYAFNYKKENIQEALEKSCPEGVDVYFDNVGGLISAQVVRNMNEYGEIFFCGSIASYNAIKKDPKGEPPLVPMDYYAMLCKQVRVTCFNTNRWQAEWFDVLRELRDLIIQGKIQVKETNYNGFENLPKAFVEMMNGKNMGKTNVKA